MLIEDEELETVININFQQLQYIVHFGAFCLAAEKR